MMVLSAQLHRGYARKPIEQLLTQIAHRNELGLHGEVLQCKPTPETCRRFPSHKAATNNANAQGHRGFFC